MYNWKTRCCESSAILNVSPYKSPSSKPNSIIRLSKSTSSLHFKQTKYFVYTAQNQKPSESHNLQEPAQNNMSTIPINNQPGLSQPMRSMTNGSGEESDFQPAVAYGQHNMEADPALDDVDGDMGDCECCDCGDDCGDCAC